MLSFSLFSLNTILLANQVLELQTRRDQVRELCAKTNAFILSILNPNFFVYHQENSIGVGTLNSAQTGKFKRLFHTSPDAVNRVGARQNVDSFVSPCNSFLSPIVLGFW